MEPGPEARHAYELLEATRGCHLFFDLDGRSDGKFNCEEVAILAPHCPPIGHEHIPNSEFRIQTQRLSEPVKIILLIIQNSDARSRIQNSDPKMPRSARGRWGWDKSKAEFRIQSPRCQDRHVGAVVGENKGNYFPRRPKAEFNSARGDHTSPEPVRKGVFGR